MGSHENRKTHLLAASMMALTLLPDALSAQEPTTQTASAGGPGGTLYSVTCSQKALVGVQGRAYDTGLLGVGTVVGSLQPICAELNADGSWYASPTVQPDTAGRGDRGTLVSLRCPQNQAVSGIFGRSGLYVNRLGIECAALKERGHLNGEGSPVAGTIGGSDGSPFSNFTCPNEKPGHGFIGRADQWIDRVGLLCAFAVARQPVVERLYLSRIPTGQTLDTAVTVVGGSAVNGQVVMNASDPPGFATLSINVPASVATFESNSMTVVGSAPFVVITNPVSRSVTASVSASPNTGTLTPAVLTIQPPSLGSLTLSAPSTSPGGSVTGSVSLTGRAFSGGLAITLASSDLATATVPASMPIHQNQTSTTFPVTVSSTNRSSCSVISATYNQVGRSVLLPVRVPGSSTFVLALTGTSGSSATGAVQVASSNKIRKFNLVSSNPALASVPSSGKVLADETAFNFPITIDPATGVHCAAITAIEEATGQRNSLILSISGRTVSVVN